MVGEWAGSRQFSLLMCGAVLVIRPSPGRALTFHAVWWVIDNAKGAHAPGFCSTHTNDHLPRISVRELFISNNDQTCTHLTSGFVQTNGSNPARFDSHLTPAFRRRRRFCFRRGRRTRKENNELPPFLISRAVLAMSSLPSETWRLISI